MPTRAVTLNSAAVSAPDREKAEKVAKFCFNLPVKWEVSSSPHRVLRFPAEILRDDGNSLVQEGQPGTPESGCLYCQQLEEYLRLALGQ